jgi:hypothetical protein
MAKEPSEAFPTIIIDNVGFAKKKSSGRSEFGKADDQG